MRTPCCSTYGLRRSKRRPPTPPRREQAVTRFPMVVSSNSSLARTTVSTSFNSLCINTHTLCRPISCGCRVAGGEIIEWAGFAIACWSLPGLAFAIMTFSNLAPRGHQVGASIASAFYVDACWRCDVQHHKWYLQKFENYPKHRKAVIPFVW
jgi:hypothetical protein